MVCCRARLFTVAGLALSALWTQAAQAKVTEIFTISNYQPPVGGLNVSGIQSVTGGWTVGTTVADDVSDVTVVENTQLGPATYVYTAPQGSGWSVPSNFGGNAGFSIGSFGPQLVTTGVSVSLNDSIFGGTGTVTITERNVTSTPEPSTWAMMLLGFAGLGLVGYRQRRMLKSAARV